MKNFSFKNIAPHLIAVAVFLIVAVIFCKPALESGVVLQQSDVTAVESMKHQSELYKQEHGVYPLWISSMFSGMPAYNIIFDGPFSPLKYIDGTLQLWLPKPLNFFFLSCICFYIFCMCVRIRPYVAIFASLAFAYSTYNPILVVAGHDTKLLAMAYAPALLGSIILLFDKKYVSGFVLTALFATLHLQQNHQQISYYLFLIIGIMSISYLIKWIKEKDLMHAAKALPLALGAALIGVMINAVTIFPVYDYAKDSKRGGQLVMDKKAIDTKNGTDKTTGLSIDYAFQWSNTKSEGLNILFPGVNGNGAYVSQRDGEYNVYPKLGESSAINTYLTEKLNVPEDQAANVVMNLSTRLYWGDKPGTTGAAYIGAVTCCLFVLGMFFLSDKHKWWILSASIFGIILAMGKSLPSINIFLFEHLPLYNKFRTPEMALVIPQFLFPMLGVMAVQKIVDGDYTDGSKKFKWTALTMGAIFALAAVLYFSFDYTKENKERMRAMSAALVQQDSSTSAKMQAINEKYQPLTDNQVFEDFVYQTKGDTKVAKEMLTALRKDRETLFRNDILKAFVFVLLTLGLIGLFINKKINSVLLLTGLPLLVLIDLLPVGFHYINEKSFETADKYAAKEFTESEADKQIFSMAGKDPNYRVFDMSGGDPFQDSKPSYFHKSIGGYHPAKIGIYDDLATYQLNGKLNRSVLNMLNAKFIIQRSQDGKETVAIPNPEALGNCWFVKGVKFVHGPVEEMNALDNFSPKDSAIIDDSFKNIIKDYTASDSAASIKQTSFDNMAIKYESNSNTNNVAVFSEVFYRDWKATIDGKEVPIAKANYVLRALVIPAGKHTIEFKFEPRVFNTSFAISKFTNWFLFALLLWFAFYSFKNMGTKKEGNVQ